MRQPTIFDNVEDLLHAALRTLMDSPCESIEQEVLKTAIKGAIIDAIEKVSNYAYRDTAYRPPTTHEAAGEGTTRRVNKYRAPQAPEKVYNTPLGGIAVDLDLLKQT